MRFVLLLWSLLFLVSCNETPGDEVLVKSKSIRQLPFRPERLMGMYTGEFKGSPLCIVIDRISHEKAGGYDLHKGIRRSLSGVVEFTEGKLYLYLVEPGDSRFDGEFHLSIDTTAWQGEGQWKSFVTGTKIPFRFKKREIIKEKDEQVFVDADSNFIILKPDGKAEYHVLNESAAEAEPILIEGHFTKKASKLYFTWEKNPVFPSTHSLFYLYSESAFKGENYVQQSLRGEGKIFNEMVFE